VVQPVDTPEEGQLNKRSASHINPDSKNPIPKKKKNQSLQGIDIQEKQQLVVT
jgi:hypothetical protein